MLGLCNCTPVDIWSVGCTVLELLMGKHPWPDLKNDWVAVYNIVRKCDSGEGPPRPSSCSPAFKSFLDRWVVWVEAAIMLAIGFLWCFPIHAIRFTGRALLLLFHFPCCSCLQLDPRDRPSAQALLAHPLFYGIAD